ncbi:hypothetical protein FQN50_007353 [Emmonsiellopsis sp. PD_5]|nr:hypothetical protein FQN50_007353 [Emmonsiellopsis sp. PD_5]
MPNNRTRKSKLPQPPSQSTTQEGAHTTIQEFSPASAGQLLRILQNAQNAENAREVAICSHSASQLWKHPAQKQKQRQKQKQEPIPLFRNQQIQQGEGGASTQPVLAMSSQRQFIESEFPPLGSQPAFARKRGRGNRRGRGRNVPRTDNVVGKGTGEVKATGGSGMGWGLDVGDRSSYIDGVDNAGTRAVGYMLGIPATTDTDNRDGGVGLNQTTSTSLLDLDLDLDVDLPRTGIPQQQQAASGAEESEGRGLLSPYNDLWTLLQDGSPQAGGNPHGGSLKDPVTDSIQQTPDYMYHFHSLIATRKDLRDIGYVLEPLTAVEIDGKRRCRGCGKVMAKYQQQVKPRKPENVQGKNGGAGRLGAGGKGDGNQGSKGKEMAEKKKGDGPEEKKKVILNCKFHKGRLRYKTWSCCRQHVSSPPCGGEPLHHARSYQPGELASLWQFHRTPPPQDRTNIRTAVAIDCEMGQAMSGDSELIRITLIDYFSSEILIDSLVYPSVPMEHYRTSFSGVTRQDMDHAMRSGTCIMGRDNARQAVWKYVGPNTIVVGHSANNDLDSLRWIHGVVVDTYVIANAIQKKEDEKKKREEEDRKKKEEKEKGVENGQLKNNNKPDEKPTMRTQTEQVKDGTAAKPNPSSSAGDNKNQPKKAKKNKGSGKCSLKTLAREKLGREIQNAGKKGHDSLEDAVAARDVADWYVSELMAAEAAGGGLLL